MVRLDPPRQAEGQGRKPGEGIAPESPSLRAAVVTPCLNSVRTIDETIASVVMQRGDFLLRYHVQDGGSTDGTVGRLEHWSELLGGGRRALTGCRGVDFTYAVAGDGGTYDVLNRAFGQVAGDLYTWIGSDDRLEVGCLQTVTSLLGEHPEIDWVTGSIAQLREDGVLCAADPPRACPFQANVLPREVLAAGLADGESFPTVQQAGTFWTERLWGRVGRALNTDLRLAGDFELWTRMARHTAPMSVLAPLGRFRRREGQLSGAMDRYMEEVRAVRAGLDAGERAAALRVVGNGSVKGRLAWCRWAEGDWCVEEKGVAVPPALRVQWSDPEAGVGWQALEGVWPRPDDPLPELIGRIT